MRKLFLIFCSVVVLTSVVSLVGMTNAQDNGLYATVSSAI